MLMHLACDTTKNVSVTVPSTSSFAMHVGVTTFSDLCKCHAEALLSLPKAQLGECNVKGNHDPSMYIRQFNVFISGCLVVQDAEGKKVPFVDTGVYTRNRAFRLVMSSKAGKDFTLKSTGRAFFFPMLDSKIAFFDQRPRCQTALFVTQDSVVATQRHVRRT